MYREDAESWSSLAYFLAPDKLDDVTKRDWENSLKDNTKCSAFKKLQEFLENAASNVSDREKVLCAAKKGKCSILKSTKESRRLSLSYKGEFRNDIAVYVIKTIFQIIVNSF